MRNKFLITALMTAVSGASLIGSANANDANLIEEPTLEFCQYKLADPLYLEDPDCINSGTSGGTYSS